MSLFSASLRICSIGKVAFRLKFGEGPEDNRFLVAEVDQRRGDIIAHRRVGGGER